MDVEVVDASEQRLDAAWQTTTLPANAIDHCFFHILTLVEDQMRFAVTRPDEYRSIIEGAKYAARSALQLAAKQCVPATGGAYEATALTHGVALKLLTVADEYESAVLAYTCYRSGDATCRLVDGRMAFWPHEHTHRYEVLDHILEATPTLGTLDLLLLWLSRAKSRPGALRTISRNVRKLDGERLDYQFVPGLAKQLADRLPRGRPLLPNAWTAWGLPAHTIVSVLRALKTRCAYHLISVYRGAAKFEIVGLGVKDLLLVSPISAVIQQVAEVSKQSKQSVEVLLTRLTYGHAQHAPDPALQPIIPLSGECVAIPCHLVLSNSMERNFLSLQARIDKASFDNQSHLFEQSMRRELETALKASGIAGLFGQASAAGEIDLLLGQVGCNAIVVCEMKWSLPPGDCKEVIERRKKIRAGGVQVHQRIVAVTQQRAHFSMLLGVPAANEDVMGFVVSQGCTEYSGYPDIPCLPFSMLLNDLRKARPLSFLLCRWRSQDWLPDPGKHYEAAETMHQIGEERFSWFGYQPSPSCFALGDW